MGGNQDHGHQLVSVSLVIGAYMSPESAVDVAAGSWVPVRVLPSAQVMIRITVIASFGIAYRRPCMSKCQVEEVKSIYDEPVSSPGPQCFWPLVVQGETGGDLSKRRAQ